MFTGLRVVGTITEKEKTPVVFSFSFDALTLLSYLQQVWPGVSAAPGAGSRDSPWQPTALKHWFFCAKLKGSGTTARRFPALTEGKAWLKVGGRFIAIDPTSLYSSDYDTDGRAVAISEPTYPKLNAMLETWRKQDPTNNTDRKLTRLLRDLLLGKGIPGAPACLPVLASVLFVSEVARNHTAYHAALMAMDLIEKGAVLEPSGANVPWTWSSAIWRDTACRGCSGTKHVTCGGCGGSGVEAAVRCAACGGAGSYAELTNCGTCCGHGGWGCGACGGTGWFQNRTTCRDCAGFGGCCCYSCSGAKTFSRSVSCRACWGSGSFVPACRVCHGHRNVPCGTCRGKGIYDEYRPLGSTSSSVQGGVDVLQNGLLPMSHKGSAFGSAFALTGTGKYTTVNGDTVLVSNAPNAVLVVRRKEATVLIHWLKLVLDACQIQFSSTKTLSLVATELTTDMNLTARDFSRAYEEVEGVALEGRTLLDDRDGDLAKEVYKTVRSKIVRCLEIRAESADYLLATT